VTFAATVRECCKVKKTHGAVGRAPPPADRRPRRSTGRRPAEVSVFNGAGWAGGPVSVRRESINRDPREWHANAIHGKLETAMTIDERLDRLTERHEALTQTIELLTHDVSELRATVKVSGTLDTKTNTILADAITAAETRR